MLTSEYVLILLWFGLCAFICTFIDLEKPINVLGVTVKRYRWWVAFLIFLPVIIMAGLRPTNFADTYLYCTTFEDMEGTVGGLVPYYRSLTKDKGWYVLSYLIRIVIGNRKIVYTCIIAFLQGICLVSVYRKYSTNYVLSLFLFMISADYIAWMYNGIRQFTAVMVLFVGTYFYIEKKYVRALILILFASLFHQSALLMIPFVLIAQGRAWNLRTIAFIVAVLLAVVFVDKFTNFLDDSLTNTQYANVVSDYKSWNDDGTNPLRVVVYSVPALLSLIGLRFIRHDGDRLINFCTNMSIISMGLYLVSMVTSGIFIGRLPIYCSLYGYILLPWLIEHMFTKKTQSVVYCLLVLSYGVFYYYQMGIAYSLI